MYGQDEPTQAPFLPDARKLELVKTLYGIQSGELIALSGYEDINFRVKNVALNEIPFDVVVKISNPVEARDADHLNLQTRICQILNSRGIPAPELVPLKDGKLWTYISVQTEKLPIRMFKTLSGDVLEKFDVDQKFLVKIGSLIGQLHQVFDEERFETSHLPFISSDNFQCFFREIDILFSKGQLDELKRNLAIKSLEDYRDNIYNRRELLDFGLIHSDLNETNILAQLSNKSELEITAVLDFGDIHMSFRGCDIANCALYLHLSFPKLSIQNIINYLIRGYETVRQFNDKNLLMFCVRVRLACSLIYGLRTSRLSVRQDNPEYILKTQVTGWNVLKELLDWPSSG